MKPHARRTDVLLQDVDPDVLVYDQVRDAAHSLNPTAAYVYAHADGTRTIEELAAGMSEALGVPNDQTLVEAALGLLGRAHLLEPTTARAVATTPGISRREMVRRLGVAAIAIPIVTSIVSPTPLMAQSVLSSSSPPPLVQQPSTSSPPPQPNPIVPSTSSPVIPLSNTQPAFDWRQWLSKYGGS